MPLHAEPEAVPGHLDRLDDAGVVDGGDQDAVAEPVDGLVIAAGFSGHGFGIAPMTALLLRDLAVGDPPRLALDAFRRARFAEGGGAGLDAGLTLHG